jgi:hypothetical protein
MCRHVYEESQAKEPQVESVDLLGDLLGTSEPATSPTVADNWTAFPSELPSAQQPVPLHQQHCQQLDNFAEQFGILNSALCGTARPCCNEVSAQQALPTLLAKLPGQESRNSRKVEDIQNCLASLYNPPPQNQFDVLDNSFTGVPVPSVTPNCPQQDLSMQQFGCMQQVMGMQHPGGRPEMNLQQMNLPRTDIQHNHMQQVNMQHSAGIPQLAAMIGVQPLVCK